MPPTSVTPQSITHGVECFADLRVTIDPSAPADLFSRAETEQFQRTLYGPEVSDRNSVLNHWAYNAIANGVNDACQLDGWADLARGTVTFHVTNFSIES